jgi:hypothetical protein
MITTGVDQGQTFQNLSPILVGCLVVLMEKIHETDQKCQNFLPVSSVKSAVYKKLFA